ncbi:hypothetical protein KCP71_00825 [Salmonella enterica subsp. enterica]|nr:hypothetical protein KCP71_00825 [Salmonella enterica subsp. enterica]
MTFTGSASRPPSLAIAKRALSLAAIFSSALQLRQQADVASLSARMLRIDSAIGQQRIAKPMTAVISVDVESGHRRKRLS